MHKKAITFLLLTSLLLTGCWDKVEIEERAQVSALGVDIYKPSPEEEGIPEAEGTVKNKFMFSFVYPKDSVEEAEDIVLKTVGQSFFGVSRVLANRTNKELFLGHLRTIILSSEVVKDKNLFREILDGIETNELISRRVIFAMTEDSASDIVSIAPEMQSRFGQFIAELFRRRDRTPRAPQGSAGDILQDLHEGGKTLIPKITPGETDVKVSGAGVIKNYEFIGWLGELDTGYLMVLKGEVPRVGGIAAEYRGHSVPIDMRLKKPKMSLIESEDNIKILIEIDAEADIKQTYFDAEYDVLKSETIEDIQELFSTKIKENMDDAVNKIQKEFKTDVLCIDRYLRQSHYDVWKTVEDDWDEIFPNIDIEVSIDVKIRRIGLTR